MERIFIILAIIICSCNANNKLPETPVDRSVKETVVKAAVTRTITPAIFRNEWNELLQLKVQKCEKVMYGGFRKVVFSFFNDSPYMIDSICVRVDYFDDKRPYKYAFATAVDIEQGNEIMIDAPASLRGDSMSYYIDHLTVSEVQMDKKFPKPKKKVPAKQI